MIDESAKFDILLTVKRGSKEEKFKVEVNEGSFHLNQMEPHGVLISLFSGYTDGVIRAWGIGCYQ